MTGMEKVSLIFALTRLVQVITLILLIHFVQAALAIMMVILHLLITMHRPGAIV